MDFFDQVGSLTDAHSKSAEKFGYIVGNYLTAHGVKNTAAVKSTLTGKDLSLGVLYDAINDPDPAPSAKALRLGLVIRRALAKNGASAAQADALGYG